MTPEDTQKLWSSIQALLTGQEITNLKLEEVNTHLGLLNGRVAKHEESINSLVIWKARGDGVKIALNAGWTLLLTILSGAVLLLGDFLIHK